MRKKIKKIDPRLLNRYLEGLGSEEDSRMVREWFNNPDLEDELFDNSIADWDKISLAPPVEGLDKHSMLEKIHHHIRIAASVFQSGTKPGIRFIDYVARAAAILLIPVLVFTGTLLHKAFPSANSASIAEIHAPLGTRTNFYLPDGSTGWLNGGSSLQFPVRFTGKSRDVDLIGEAYFNVTTNPKKAFTITTEYIDVLVHGTTLNIAAYPGENNTEITLETGQIQIFKKSDNKTVSIARLDSGQTCIYDHVADSSVIITANSADRTSWKEGKLVFKNMPFAEVVKKINRWYNVNIVIKDKRLESYMYYATFEDEMLDEVLKLLQYSAPIHCMELGRNKRQDGTFEKRQIEFFYKD